MANETLQTIAFILGGLFLPVTAALMAVLLRHMHEDHAIELDVKMRQSFLEGEAKGLNERISRLEDIHDFQEQRAAGRRRSPTTD